MQEMWAESSNAWDAHSIELKKNKKNDALMNLSGKSFSLMCLHESDYSSYFILPFILQWVSECSTYEFLQGFLHPLRLPYVALHL